MIFLDDYPEYAVTADGRIWSERRKKYLKPYLNQWGTPIVRIYDSLGVRKEFTLHNLVARVYLPFNGDDYSRVRHRDGDKLNNHYSNLYWASELGQSESWHGTPGGYSNHDCRCDECRVAWNSYMVQHRKNKAATFEPDENTQHGNAQTYRYGCRCDLCATTARNADRRRVTAEEYDALFEEQGGVCAICGKAPRAGKKLNVDHIHGTQIIRGLLCHGCNTGLGKLGDSISGLERALKYLRNTTPEAE